MIVEIIRYTLVLVLAVLLGIRLLDRHRHQCETCGLVWTHYGLWAGGSPKHPRALAAHTCRRCGVQCWERLIRRA